MGSWFSSEPENKVSRCLEDEYVILEPRPKPKPKRPTPPPPRDTRRTRKKKLKQHWKSQYSAYGGQ